MIAPWEIDIDKLEAKINDLISEAAKLAADGCDCTEEAHDITVLLKVYHELGGTRWQENPEMEIPF